MSEINKEVSFVLNLMTVSSLVHKRVDGYLGAVHGIGFTEYLVLFHLNMGFDKKMKRIDLANAMSLTASGVTRVLIPMEKQGLVSKEATERDARISLVKLTSAGERILTDATISLRESSERLLDGVAQGKLSSTLEVFKLIGKDAYV